jgi:hypothetical protein
MSPYMPRFVHNTSVNSNVNRPKPQTLNPSPKPQTLNPSPKPQTPTPTLAGIYAWLLAYVNKTQDKGVPVSPEPRNPTLWPLILAPKKFGLKVSVPVSRLCISPPNP